jgi:hypothetical protein
MPQPLPRSPAANIATLEAIRFKPALRVYRSLATNLRNKSAILVMISAAIPVINVAGGLVPRMYSVDNVLNLAANVARAGQPSHQRIGKTEPPASRRQPREPI